jgi:uncharacterized protein
MSTPIQYLPMFPLGIFMLPHEQIPLHIFEPRFKQLFDDLAQGDTRFGLPITEPDGANLVSICKLNEVTKQKDNGERDVIIECIQVAELFRIDDQMSGKLYPGGEVGSLIEFDMNTTASVEVLELFADYIELRFGRRPKLIEIKNYSLTDVAACLALSNENKVRFAKAKNVKAQQKMIVGLIEYLRFLFYQETKTENGIILN